MIHNVLRDTNSFSKLMFDLYEVINRVIKPDTSRLAAMEIGCGYHSYIFGIAMWNLQVYVLNHIAW